MGIPALFACVFDGSFTLLFGFGEGKEECNEIETLIGIEQKSVMIEAWFFTRLFRGFVHLFAFINFKARSRNFNGKIVV